MENTSFNKVQYDYYSNSSSYVKMIMDLIPERMASFQKKQVVQELYNYFLNRYDQEKIKEIAKISSLFRDKVSVTSFEETVEFVKFIYANYIDKIVFDSANRETVFNILNDNMKVYVGYFSTYGENSYNETDKDASYTR